MNYFHTDPPSFKHAGHDLEQSQQGRLHNDQWLTVTNPYPLFDELWPPVPAPDVNLSPYELSASFATQDQAAYDLPISNSSLNFDDYNNLNFDSYINYLGTPSIDVRADTPLLHASGSAPGSPTASLDPLPSSLGLSSLADLPTGSMVRPCSLSRL